VDIEGWLRGLGLERYAGAFCGNEIDAAVLPRLTDEHLKELGLPLGPRLKLLEAIARLRDDAAPRAPAPGEPVAAGTPSVAAAERRQLTVVFCDLVGSTALSRRLDPEEMREVLRAYQDAVAGEIVRYGGHLAKFLGDGVLAYFGWPRAQEDAAERAVRAGLSVASAVPRLATPAGEPLAARVGIATGLVVVGDLLGEGAAREEAVVGETPNLAARLQEAAEPGAVLVADGTRRLLGEVFGLHALGALDLKGFAQPVAAFRVLGERPAGSRFETRRPGGPLPMVGRDRELALVLERWRQAASGEGQAVLLIGEAGIGKSRLVRAVLDRLAGEEHTALRYQCSPYHIGTPLWPVAQQLAFAAGLEPADDDAAKLDRLEALLRQGAEDVGEAAPLVAALLGIDAGARHPALRDLTPQQRRARTLAALVDQLLGLARRRGSVLMVLEDAHWIDPTTLELLDQALSRIADARVLMLATSRPDNRPSLGGHPHLTRLTLDRLGRGPTGAIVARLAGGRVLPPGLAEEIARRTDGVPLFVEELTKAVLEAGAAGAGAAVPSSLHDTLMARLDRVPGVKAVAQVAACVGREFAYPLLAAASPVPGPELRAALDRLVAAELVFARGEPPAVSYSFKHALVRDAAHESLLRSERRRLHARIAEALERGFPALAEDQPELLAQHCVEAGLAERAVTYLQRATRRALARSAELEAVRHLERALEQLDGVPDATRRAGLDFELRATLGRALSTVRGFTAPETGLAYERAAELGRDLGRDPRLFPVLWGLFIFHHSAGRIATGNRIAREFLRLAELQGDPGQLLTAERTLANSELLMGRFASARRHAERAVALYDPAAHRALALDYAYDQRVVARDLLTATLFALGHPEQAGAQIRQAVAEAEALGHRASLAHALSFDCIFRQWRGEAAAIRRNATAMERLVEEQAIPFWSNKISALKGWAVGREGSPEAGAAEIARAMEGMRAIGARVFRSYFLAILAETGGCGGRHEDALRHVAEGLREARDTGERWYEAELLRLKGDALARLGDPAAARAALEDALLVAREQEALMWELRAATSLARLCAERGERRKAHDLLAPVHDRFTEGFDTPDLQEAKGLLDELR
jgi:class 3 adenylate cyclase/predicted ATPase